MYLAGLKFSKMSNSYSRFASVLLVSFIAANCFSQSVSINNDGAAASSAAILDVNSTTKGLLIPRMTAQQKDAILNPVEGLLVYQTDAEYGFYFYNGIRWYLLVTTAVTDKQNTLIYTTKGF